LFKTDIYIKLKQNIWWSILLSSLSIFFFSCYWFR